MRYRVTTNLLACSDKGETISKLVYKNLKVAGCSESWFEPVEQVQEGQYWDWLEDVVRVADCNDLYVTVSSISGSTNVDRIPICQLQKEAVKLSDDDIEQALIEEAKRRGYKYDNFKCIQDGLNWGLEGNHEKYWDYDYDFANDQLMLDAGVLYEQGKWAKKVDKWEVHTNVTPIQIVSPSGRIDAVGDGLTKEQAEAIAEALNNLDSND